MRIDSGVERNARVSELFRNVGLRPEHEFLFPHQFYGGQRQRIGIARALASRPELIVCDEPVSHLDAAIQAQILNLLRRLQGDPSSPIDLPEGCRFFSRCSFAKGICREEKPRLEEIQKGHLVASHPVSKG